MLHLYNQIAPALGLKKYGEGEPEPKVFETARAIRSALKSDPRETMCALMGPECNMICGDHPEDTVCAKFEKLLVQQSRCQR